MARTASSRRSSQDSSARVVADLEAVDARGGGLLQHRLQAERRGGAGVPLPEEGVGAEAGAHGPEACRSLRQPVNRLTNFGQPVGRSLPDARSRTLGCARAHSPAQRPGRAEPGWEHREHLRRHRGDPPPARPLHRRHHRARLAAAARAPAGRDLRRRAARRCARRWPRSRCSGSSRSGRARAPTCAAARRSCCPRRCPGGCCWASRRPASWCRSGTAWRCRPPGWPPAPSAPRGWPRWPGTSTPCARRRTTSRPSPPPTSASTRSWPSRPATPCSTRCCRASAR